MRLKNYLLALIAIASTSAGFAQGNQGSIKGRIYDDANEPVQFAEVWVDIGAGNKMTVETDEKGWYNIKPLSPGTYTLFATVFGYDTTIIDGIKVKIDQVKMMNDIDIIAAVKITEKKMIDPSDPTAIDIDAEMLEHSPTLRDPATMISSISPEIKQGSNGELYFRGSRNGASIYYIDGVKLTGDLANLPGRAYGSVKVYTGGVPAKYGDTTGGVVAIETQSYFNLWRAKMMERERAKRKANQPNN